MSLFREIPPTAGFPFYPQDIFSLFSRKNNKGSLEEDFQNYLGAAFSRITCSGTAAFYLILEGLKSISSKKTIVIPAFVCPLLPLAINRAGLRAEVCDTQKDSFDFERKKLEELMRQGLDILAVVAVHLGGIPADMLWLREAAASRGIFLIEDCAQSLGTLYKGKPTGTWGDFSFFSLCRGKGLTIYEGGALAANNKAHIPVIEAAIKRLVKNNFLIEILRLLELFGYWLFYRPGLFWFIFAAPKAFWEWRRQPIKALAEDFSIDFPLHNVSAIRKTLGHISFNRLEQQIKEQRQKAAYYIKELAHTPRIKLITGSSQDRPVYPYLTLLFDTPELRLKIQRKLEKLGLGASRIYNSEISSYEYLKGIVADTECPNARSLARRAITLSTNTFLREKDAAQLVKIIKVNALVGEV